MVSTSYWPSLQLLNMPMDMTRREIVQENELDSKCLKQNLFRENVFGKITLPDTVLSTSEDSVKSTFLTSSPKGSCQKRKRPQLKVKCNPSNDECLEQKVPERDNKIEIDNELFCKICNMNFSCLESVEEHKDQNVFLCRVCIGEFNDHDTLEAHFLTHTKIKCKDCKEEFFCTKDLLLHKSKMHTAKKFECTKCLKTCASQYGLRLHVMITHGDGENDCMCVVCGKNYKHSFQLKQHLKLTHVVYEHLQCRFCHMLYLGPNKLQAHIKEIHLNSDKNTPVSCSTCGKFFNRASLLEKHQETHDNIESVCEICGKLIKTKSLMISHMESQHPKTGKFTCKTCNKQFDDKKDFRKHQKLHHYQKRSKSVFCEICGKVYKNSQVLKLHKAIHIDVRPFKCDICDATFKQSVALRTHQRVHSNVGKYTCNSCGNNFKWKQTFDKHIDKCEANTDSKIDFENK